LSREQKTQIYWNQSNRMPPPLGMDSRGLWNPVCGSDSSR